MKILWLYSMLKRLRQNREAEKEWRRQDMAEAQKMLTERKKDRHHYNRDIERALKRRAKGKGPFY